MTAHRSRSRGEKGALTLGSILIALAVGSFMAVLLSVVPSGSKVAKAEHVTPVFWEGNPPPECDDIGYPDAEQYNSQTQPPSPGSTANGAITWTHDGTYLDWDSDGSVTVLAVIMKGGDDANIYHYNPPATTSDDNLHAPLNPSGAPAGISHIVICWEESEPNVGIAKTNDTEDSVAASGSFNWILTVTVTNGPTTDVATITDTIPSALSAGAPVAADPPFDCSATVGNSISCTLDSGTADGNYIITVPVTAPDGTPDTECAQYNNTASVTGGGGTNTPSSDSDSVTVTCTPVPDPNVGIAKTNNTEGSVEVGGTFNWLLTVTVSNGPTTAVATITDTIPPALSAGAPVAADPPFDCSATVGNSISCTLDSDTADGNYIITVPVTAPDGTPDTECAQYNNTASVTGGGGTNTPSSDSDSVEVTGCTVELDLSSSASDNAIDPGDEVFDTAFLSGNQGPVEGTVTFFVCGPENDQPDCGPGEGTLVSVETLTAADNGEVDSNVITPDEPGWYCFRFEFDPADNSPYSAAEHTNQTSECFLVREEDDETPLPEPTPFVQVQQVQATPVPPAPTRTPVAEVLPARLPTTGVADNGHMTIRFAGLALVLLGLGGVALVIARREA